MYRCSADSSPDNVSHSRCVACSRTRATSRANVVTPGSSTCRSRSHATLASNKAFGPSPRRPRPRIHPRLDLADRIGEVPVAVPTADLPHVLEAVLLPLRVGLQARRVPDPELSRDVVDDLDRNVDRVVQERAEHPHSAQLNPEPKPQMIPSQRPDQPTAGVVQEEEPFQLCT